MTTSLDALQNLAARVLIGALAAFVVVAPAAAVFIDPGKALPAGLIALLVAGGAFGLYRAAGADSTTRIAIGASMSVGPALMLFVFAGHPWQLDIHMMFFATLAVTAMLCDWRAVLAGAATTAVHHLAFNFVVPAFVFPDGADFARVVLHAVIVVGETGALIWLCHKLTTTLAAADAQVVEIERQIEKVERLGKERAETERVAKERELAEHRRKLEEDRIRAEREERERAEREEAAAAALEAERRKVMHDMSDAFSSVVSSAKNGDFAVRVTRTFNDADLDGLAQSLNDLLSVTERNIRGTAAAVKAIAAADLTQRAENNASGLFGDLCGDVNATIDFLDGVVSELRTSSMRLAASTKELGGGADELAGRTMRQAAAIEETSASLESFTTAMREYATQATSARKDVEEISGAAQRGGETMRSATDAMRKIEESTTEVTAILETIEAISFQTRLLSLNASVEAARAGEAGRGFSVVAEEIRTLANTTQEASRKIRDLVERSNADVGEGVGRIDAARQEIEGVLEGMSRVISAVGGIASSCDSHVETLNEVGSAMRQLDGMTQQNAAMAEETQAAAQQTSGLAATLDDLCGRFTTRNTASNKRAAA